MHTARNLLAMLVLSFVVPAFAQSGKPWTQVGMLTCKLNPSIGFIIAGHQSMECRYVPGAGGPPQGYDGALNTVGVSLGVTAGGVLSWAVLAPTDGIPAGVKLKFPDLRRTKIDQNAEHRSTRSFAVERIIV